MPDLLTIGAFWAAALGCAVPLFVPPRTSPRERLANAGIETGGEVVVNGSVVAPTLSQPAAVIVRGLADVAVTFIGDRAGWTGGTVYLGAQAFVGPRGDALTGDLQTFDNADADPFAGLAQAWLQQELWGGRLRFKLGRMEANDEFGSMAERQIKGRVRSRKEFVQSSMGFSPTIVDFPSYPVQSFGALIEGVPHEHVRVQGGVYDGALTRPVIGAAPNPAVYTPFSSLLTIGELGVSWSPRRLDGHVTAGGWGRLRESVCDADGCGTPAGMHSYAFQTVARERGTAEQGVAVFVQYAWTPPRYSGISQHAGGGVSATGAVPSRDDDVMGLGASWIRVALDERRGSEASIDVFYKVVLGPAYVQPDVQVLVTPGGFGRTGVAATLRLGHAL